MFCSAHVCSERYFNKLIGKREVEDALQRLDTLTQEEARMAQAELLKITHNVKECVKDVKDKVDVIIDSMQTLVIWSPSPF